MCGWAGGLLETQQAGRVSLYQSWLYMIILPLMTQDSTGIVVVANMPVRISVHEVCHLVIYMKIGCT